MPSSAVIGDRVDNISKQAFGSWKGKWEQINRMTSGLVEVRSNSLASASRCGMQFFQVISCSCNVDVDDGASEPQIVVWDALGVKNDMTVKKRTAG